MKTLTIKSSSEKEIKSAIEKNIPMYDCIKVDSASVTGASLVRMVQAASLDTGTTVYVVYDGKPEVWRTRRDAMEFYESQWRKATGEQADRCLNVWSKLDRRYKLATDEA